MQFYTSCRKFFRKSTRHTVHFYKHFNKAKKIQASVNVVKTQNK